MNVLQTPQNLTYPKQIHLISDPISNTISSPNLLVSKMAPIIQPKSEIDSSFFLTSQRQSFRKSCLLELQSVSSTYNFFFPRLPLKFKFCYFLLELLKSLFNWLVSQLLFLLSHIPFPTKQLE